MLTLWGTGAEMLVWNPSVQVLKRQPELLGLLGTLPGLNYYYYIYEFARDKTTVGRIQRGAGKRKAPPVGPCPLLQLPSEL